VTGEVPPGLKGREAALLYAANLWPSLADNCSSMIKEIL
jgi:hypothetical protein